MNHLGPIGSAAVGASFVAFLLIVAAAAAHWRSERVGATTPSPRRNPLPVGDAFGGLQVPRVAGRDVPRVAP